MNKRTENIKKLNTKMFGERLEKLLELILKTTTYKDDNANLFHTHQILTENWLDRLNSGWMDLASERVEMMKQANNIWAVRKKIESGEVQEDENGLLEMEIKNFINNNEKTFLEYFQNISKEMQEQSMQEEIISPDDQFQYDSMQNRGDEKTVKEFLFGKKFDGDEILKRGWGKT